MTSFTKNYKCLIFNLVLAALLLLPAMVMAERVGQFDNSSGIVAATEDTGPPCTRIAEASHAKPEFVFSAAEEGAKDELAAIAEWNRGGGEPLKNGFSRAFAVPQKVVLTDQSAAGLATSASGFSQGLLAKVDEDYVWSTRVQVEGAYRLRLHLSDLRLPQESVMWVYGKEDETPVRFGTELAYDGSLWTPSVKGDTLFFELTIPADAVSDASGFTVDSVLELFELNDAGEPLPAASLEVDESCLASAACYNDSNWHYMSNAKKAAGRMQYIKNGSGYLCSGGLLNSTLNDGTPYFLTANHCFSTQAAASTLEVWFDYIPVSCGGPLPASGPATAGATLLATRVECDSTLVRLGQNPPGRVYLGWDSATFPSGLHLYRLSYPHGWPMHYTVTRSTSPSGTCPGWPTSTQLYQDMGLGSTAGGSSGSPVMDYDGYVVGQLHGKCGPSPTETCNTSNYIVDGRFSCFYPDAQPYLSPGGAPGPGPTEPCVPNATTLCLNNGDFRVQVQWRDYQGNTGKGQAVPCGTDDSGMFWFFNSTNWEMLIKVLNGCGFNNRFWVYFAATTDVQFTVTVTDTLFGVTKTYTNPLGHAADAVTDSNAFATCGGM